MWRALRSSDIAPNTATSNTTPHNLSRRAAIDRQRVGELVRNQCVVHSHFCCHPASIGPRGRFLNFEVLLMGICTTSLISHPNHRLAGSALNAANNQPLCKSCWGWRRAARGCRLGNESTNIGGKQRAILCGHCQRHAAPIQAGGCVLQEDHSPKPYCCLHYSSALNRRKTVGCGDDGRPHLRSYAFKARVLSARATQPEQP